MTEKKSEPLDKKKVDFFRKDKCLIRKIKQSNSHAFKYLMNKYFKELADFAYQYVKSPHTSKDIVQDVFAYIWEQRVSWEPTESLKLYLYQAVKNKALNYKRNNKTERKYIKAYIEERGKKKVYPKKWDESDQFKKDVQHAIQNLPHRARMAYKLHRRDGLTYKEIAKVMDISHKTVESQISRALKILRKQLSSHLPILSLAFLLENIIP